MIVLLGDTGLLKLRNRASRFHGFDGSSLEGVHQNFICDTCFDISTFAEDVLADPDTLANIIDYVNVSLCNPLSSFQEEVIISFQNSQKYSVFSKLPNYYKFFQNSSKYSSFFKICKYPSDPEIPSL